MLTTWAGNDEISDTDQNYMGLHTGGRGGTPILFGRRYHDDPAGTVPESLGRGRTVTPEKPIAPLLHHPYPSSTVYIGACPKDRLYHTIHPHLSRRHETSRAVRQNHEEIAPRRLQNIDTTGIRSIAQRANVLVTADI